MSDIHEQARSAASAADDVLDDDVVRLLRLAGRRPEVPAHHAMQVETAARDEWRRMVAARRRRTRYLQGGGLLAAAAVLLLVLAPRVFRPALPGAPSLATVVASTGLAQTRAAEGAAPVALERGQELAVGAALETAADARVAVRLEGGGWLRLAEGTRARLISASLVALETGEVYVDTDAGASVRVRTPVGIARDVGTRFEVGYWPDAEVPLRVKVRDGLVRLERDGEASRDVAAGEALELRADGTLALVELPADGSAWHASFAVEGRSIQDFLEWVAVEGGFELRFADEPTAERVAEEKMHGSPLSGMTLEEAISLVLYDVDHRLEHGVLWVGGK